MPGKLICICAFMLVSLLSNRNSLGDVVYLNDQSTLHGLIVSQESGVIQFLKFEGGEELKLLSIPRSEVFRVIKTVDATVLGQITPNYPDRYRDNAELLASYPNDRYAQFLARRLYGLAAFHGRDKVRKSGFKGMIKFASAKQERRIRALAFQVDPRHDPNWLTPAGTAENPNFEQTISDGQKQLLLKCLRMLRHRKFTESQTLLGEFYDKQETNLHGDRRFQTTIDSALQTIEQLIRSQDIDQENYRRLIEIELELVGSDKRSDAWRNLIGAEQPEFQQVSFQSVLDFDPQKGFFANGEWTTSGR